MTDIMERVDGRQLQVQQNLNYVRAELEIALKVLHDPCYVKDAKFPGCVDSLRSIVFDCLEKVKEVQDLNRGAE